MHVHALVCTFCVLFWLTLTISLSLEHSTRNSYHSNQCLLPHTQLHGVNYNSYYAVHVYCDSVHVATSDIIGLYYTLATCTPMLHR